MSNSAFIRTTVFALLAICLFGVRLMLARNDIDPEATSMLKRWISAEYVRYQSARDDISLAEKAELLSSAENIEFVSLTARGKPERMVFRVDLVANPAQPPGTPTIRYFRMEHSMLLGWNASIPKRADAVIYFLALFML